MTRAIKLVFAILFLAIPAFPQQAAAPTAKPETNPISNHLREDVADNAKNMVAAAEEMPNDKYSFRPTPQQMTFGHLIVHATMGNFFFCSSISGMPRPDMKIAEADGKDKLVAALKSSYDFCTSSLAKVDDSNLGDILPLFGGRTVSRGGMMMLVSAECSDHYAMAAMYLRLNGLLPPTAKKEK